MKCEKAVGALEQTKYQLSRGNFGIKIMYIVQLHHEHGTDAIGLAKTTSDTNLQGEYVTSRSATIATITVGSNSGHTLFKYMGESCR